MSARRAAVLGSPIAHSLSPQLHLAAYAALGLADWTYERIECGAAELPSLVGGFGPEWVGVSVTMPGKFAALQFADERTAASRTRRVGEHAGPDRGGLAGRQHRRRRGVRRTRRGLRGPERHRQGRSPGFGRYRARRGRRPRRARGQ